MDSLHYFYLGALVPIGLLWAALQDFVGNADTPAQRVRVRRVGQIIAVIGLAHPGLAFVGYDVVRTVTEDEPSHDALRGVFAITAVSCVLAAIGAVAWFLR